VNYTLGKTEGPIQTALATLGRQDTKRRQETKNKAKNSTLSEHFLFPIEQILERGKIATPSTQIHDHSLCWLGTGTSINSDGVKLFVLPYYLSFLRRVFVDTSYITSLFLYTLNGRKCSLQLVRILVFTFI
jgi:hypothetical protein